MTGARLLRASLALALLLGCATPGLPLEVSGWHEVRVPGLVVLGNAEPALLRELTGELARFAALVRKITNARVADASHPVVLHVFRDETQAKSFVGSAAGVMFSDLPGYFAVLSAEASPYWTRHVLLHEYTHFVVQSGRRHPYPRWYEEGLCEFLSASRFRDDAVIVGASLSDRLTTLRRSGPLPLDDLFGREFWRVDTYRFYATAWALVHHLNTRRESRAALGRYVERLVRGEPWPSAYAASFEQSVGELEASLAQHIEKLQRGVRMDSHLPLDSLVVPEEWTERSVPAAEVAYRLGQVARLLADESDQARARSLARRLFEQALDEEPDNARSRAALAVLDAQEERWDAASQALVRVAPAVSSDPVVALETARVAVLRAAESEGGSAQAASARDAVELALQLAPDSAEVHAVQGRFEAEQGQTGRAITALERARELGVWSPRVDLELARQYVAIGEEDRARALLRPIAGDVHGGRTGAAARELLESLGGER